MNEYNKRVVARLMQAIDAFMADTIGLDEVQSHLQSSVNLLEADTRGTRELVRTAEADIEELRFTRLRDEQRPAAVFRLDTLRESLRADMGNG